MELCSLPQKGSPSKGARSLGTSARPRSSGGSALSRRAPRRPQCGRSIRSGRWRGPTVRCMRGTFTTELGPDSNGRRRLCSCVSNATATSNACEGFPSDAGPQCVWSRRAGSAGFSGQRTRGRLIAATGLAQTGAGEPRRALHPPWPAGRAGSTGCGSAQLPVMPRRSLRFAAAIQHRPRQPDCGSNLRDATM